VTEGVGVPQNQRASAGSWRWLTVWVRLRCRLDCRQLFMGTVADTGGDGVWAAVEGYKNHRQRRHDDEGNPRGATRRADSRFG